MDYKIVKAKNAMRAVAKKRSLPPAKKSHKQWAMRQYKKQRKAPKQIEINLDKNYSKYIEHAILVTIGLGVLSVSHPEVAPLAGILGLIIIAAIIDSKLKEYLSLAKSEDKNEAPSPISVRNLQSEFRNKKVMPAIDVEHNEEIMTLTEFPYPKTVNQ